ncbi:FAD-dependent oxidoreductase [uncultured Cyclobacterium sp.]|uniref:FAD-dependent oxidoreductase n=1 Tax=uncultured Cyclobacterium sp. TaxID=453820 RepID=UPI0030EE8D82|tara:strand:- start:279963 stop:281600 length:1638 start_codon:yes stop_codon:yes gene_type:complete
MKFSRIIYLLTVFVLLNACNNEVQQDDYTTDICVLGGSEAGFTAAIQAARLGKKVVLIEPTGHPGGMVVEGLGKDMRFGNTIVIGGIAREFYETVENHYGLKAEFDNPKWYSKYEPSVAEETIELLLEKEKNISIIRGARIKEQNGVVKNGKVIEKVMLENGLTIKAKVFIDASIEGHLLHFAGISTETIREGNEKYGETLNGVQEVNTFKQFTVEVDPYIIKGDSSSGLIPTIQSGSLGNHGDPSHYIQGFCFRMCLTKEESNRIPIHKPEGYEPEKYEIYRRYLKAGGKLFSPAPNRHNGKTDIGSWHDLSANLYGENWEYPEGNYEKQDSIINYHRAFTMGLLWFLQNDESVDSLTRANWEGWGLPKDEFTDNGNWPRRLYIRSGRRMVSDYVITEYNTDINNKDTISDPVAIAWWPPDMHHARRIVKDGKAYNEGFTHVENDNSWKPFKISFQSSVPKKEECVNLLTPTCLSSSYVGYGSIRIVPTFMVLGQSIGAAAALAVSEDIAVQDIPYTELEKVLLSQDQLLSLPDNWLEIITNNN